MDNMTTFERRAAYSLATIFALRMLGLFMILPVFALYAEHLSEVTPVLVGVAIGIYGLSQAVLGIPFGMASDRFGRKPVIFFGLAVWNVQLEWIYNAELVANKGGAVTLDRGKPFDGSRAGLFVLRGAECGFLSFSGLRLVSAGSGFEIVSGAHDIEIADCEITGCAMAVNAPVPVKKIVVKVAVG